ncbi:MAG: FAD-dependent oxidoreductase [Geminicoccaceae bacterium]|nr:FAD-dependent oxidoreductase [Geminicoccaceae bacterium]
MHHDLLIIGAGAAGIAAARAAGEAGLECRVLEARGRVGGRCHAVRPSAAPAVLDLGASWLHAADEGHPLLAHGRRFGLTVAIDPKRRELFAGRRRLGLDAARAYEAAAARLPCPMPQPASLATLFDDPDPWASTLARHFARAVCGVEPEEADLADWLDAADGADWLVAEGYGTLLARLAEGLPITLDCAVRGIEVGPDAVRATTDRGTASAAHAIVTVPLPLLARGRPRIVPPLPDATLAALDALPSGVLLKAPLALEARPLGHDSTWYLQSVGDDAAPFFLMRPFGADLAYAFFGGDAARALEAAGGAAAAAAAIDGLVAHLGADVRRAVRPLPLHAWGSDPWALGSYSVARPGGLWARAALRTPLFDRLWLAGEANAPASRQATVAGAWLAGEAAVHGIVAA